MKRMIANRSSCAAFGLAMCAVCAVPTAPARGAGGAESWCFGAAPIPDGQSATRTVVVPPGPSPRTLTAVRVRVAASHPWVGDLEFVLRHPSGMEVVLLDRPGVPSIGYPGPWGCGGSDLDVMFDDSATLEAETACPYGAQPVLAGPLRPMGSLAALAGRAPQGVWSLVVRDAVAGDAGAVTSACIEIETAPDCNANGVPDAIDISSGASADANGDGVPDECGCVGDIDGDALVGGADLAAMLGSWGACGRCAADLTGDGVVAGDDLALLLSAWGVCGPS